MKRSELFDAINDYCLQHSTTMDSGDAAAILEIVEAKLTPSWDPEEPEGFREWWEQQPVIALGLSVPKAKALCLSAWNACLSLQEAQQRTIKPKVDPEVRRKEIEAKIESWAHFQYGVLSARVPVNEWIAAARGLLRNYLRLEGY